MDLGSSSSGGSPNVITAYITHYRRLYNKYLDSTVPHIGARWIAFGALLAVFLIRVILAQGWYVVCYALGIYLLNLFLLFLQPKFDPSLEQELQNENIEEGGGDSSSAAAGPSSAGGAGDYDDGEFRPFIRRLPEFKFWYNAIRATIASLFISLFEIFDIPVFWPILLIYFILLFILTMRRQLQHMMKYKYLPFDLGKAKYNK